MCLLQSGLREAFLNLQFGSAPASYTLATGCYVTGHKAAHSATSSAKVKNDFHSPT